MDRFEQHERAHEEREKAARVLAGALGLEPEGAAPRRDEQGRYVSADAGERTPAETPDAPGPGEQLRDILLLDGHGWPRR